MKIHLENAVFDSESERSFYLITTQDIGFQGRTLFLKLNMFRWEQGLL